MKLTAIIAITLAIATATEAAVVTYDFGGVVSQLLKWQGDNLLPIEIGDPISGAFSLDLQRTTPDPFERFPETQVRWKEMIVSFELSVAGLDFTIVAGSIGSVVIRNDFGDMGLVHDTIQINSPKLQTGGMSIHSSALRVQDWTAEIFSDLSRQFVLFVDVLAEVGEFAAGCNNSDLLRAHDLWLRTRSPRLEKRLRAACIIPLRQASSH